MKQHKFLLLTAFAIAMMFGTSCKKSFFTDVNNNPDAPASVGEANYLPSIEAGIAYTQGGDLSRFTSLLDQQTFGASRQVQGYYEYTLAEGDFDNLWSNLYETCMNNNLLLIQEADGDGNNEYAGIARLLMAYSLQLTVDNWGDIPYSQAFQGVNNLHPTYDKAADVYTAILGLIDDGIAKLNDPSPGGLLPGDDDVIYGGDASNWILFGHALKARLYIHQSKNNPSMAQNALDEANQSFTDNSQNGAFVFGTSETNANPWYQFNEQRGDVSFSGSTLAAQLLATNDPRYTVFIDSANDFSGFGLAAYYGAINAPVEFITYDEIDFIKAEATLRATGDFGAATTSYNDGVTDNMAKLGVDSAAAATYLAANPLPTGSVDGAIAQIGAQEWIALYLNPEEFSTWRRINSPNLTPVNGGEVPRRLLYPSNERSYNGANTPVSNLFTPKLFWDN